MLFLFALLLSAHVYLYFDILLLLYSMPAVMEALAKKNASPSDVLDIIMDTRGPPAGDVPQTLVASAAASGDSNFYLPFDLFLCYFFLTAVSSYQVLGLRFLRRGTVPRHPRRALQALCPWVSWDL